MSEVGQRETSINPEIKKVEIMNSFHQKSQAIESALIENRESIKQSRPRGVIVMSLWEEDDSLLATKMAKNSITEILKQAKNSEIDLDIVVVANNGGGKTTELGETMRSELEIFANDKLEDVMKVETTRPEGELKTTDSWNLDIPLADPNKKSEGRSRLVLVNQPMNDLNKGKLRSIRDVTTALSKEIIGNGYSPDFVMEMDAESTLMFSKSPLRGEEETFPPLKVMWNHFNRRGSIGVGTKDRFAIMDSDTGKPKLNIPVGSSQRGYELANTRNNFITLPGGAMMVKPEYYLAGMSTISEQAPGMGVHDYMFTKILREEMKETGKVFEKEAKTLDVVNHVNRTPEDWKAAINQMKNWKLHAQAADQIFPDRPYQPEPFVKYVWLVLNARFRDASEKGPEHLKKLLHDVVEIPENLKFLMDNTPADIFQEGTINWSPKEINT